MSEAAAGVTLFRRWTLLLLTVIAVALVGRLAVSIYDEAHPRDVEVWCSDHPNDKNWDRSYQGPADLVLGACQAGYGTNNP